MFEAMRRPNTPSHDREEASLTAVVQLAGFTYEVISKITIFWLKQLQSRSSLKLLIFFFYLVVSHGGGSFNINIRCNALHVCSVPLAFFHRYKFPRQLTRGSYF